MAYQDIILHSHVADRFGNVHECDLGRVAAAVDIDQMACVPIHAAPVLPLRIEEPDHGEEPDQVDQVQVRMFQEVFDRALWVRSHIAGKCQRLRQDPMNLPSMFQEMNGCVEVRGICIEEHQLMMRIDMLPRGASRKPLIMSSRRRVVLVKHLSQTAAECRRDGRMERDRLVRRRFDARRRRGTAALQFSQGEDDRLLDRRAAFGGLQILQQVPSTGAVNLSQQTDRLFALGGLCTASHLFQKRPRCFRLAPHQRLCRLAKKLRGVGSTFHKLLDEYLGRRATLREILDGDKARSDSAFHKVRSHQLAMGGVTPAEVRNGQNQTPHSGCFPFVRTGLEGRHDKRLDVAAVGLKHFFDQPGRYRRTALI